jgi:diguanylate cyclase (GGDEF)-like protein
LKLPVPHRIARIYYVPRVLGFALTFIATLVLFREHSISAALLAYGALLFLLYPQLVYLWACLAADKKRAALHGLLLDSFLLGTWVAALGFNLGMAFALFSAVSINNAISVGMKGALVGTACFAAGCLVAIGLLGFRFDPAGNPVTLYLALPCLLIYMMKVATVMNAQNALLVQANLTNDRKRALFQVLASAGLAAASAQTLDELVAGWLDHLQPVLPAGSAFGAVVRAPQRHRLVYNASFRGLDGSEQESLLAACVETGSRELVDHGPDPAHPETHEVFLIPVKAALLDAFFVLRRDHRITEAERSTILLFLQQLGAALSSYGLTQKLTELANTDGLTGLANRSRLDERLAQLIEQKRQWPSSDFTVVMVDINGLKQANDRHGHEVGDHLIIAAGKALKRTCRDTDLVARMGGDEFVVLCHSTTRDQADHFLERLGAAVDGTLVPVQAAAGEAGELPLNLSLGVADSSETEAEAVMMLADHRMYADKAAYYRSHPRRG